MPAGAVVPARGRPAGMVAGACSEAGRGGGRQRGGGRPCAPRATTREGALCHRRAQGTEMHGPARPRVAARLGRRLQGALALLICSMHVAGVDVSDAMEVPQREEHHAHVDIHLLHAYIDVYTFGTHASARACTHVHAHAYTHAHRPTDPQTHTPTLGHAPHKHPRTHSLCSHSFVLPHSLPIFLVPPFLPLCLSVSFCLTLVSRPVPVYVDTAHAER